MAKSKTKLVYGNADTDFTLFFEHEELATMTKVDRSLYQEALDRFGSLLRENVDKRNEYERNEGSPNAGIQATIELLKTANSLEDTLSLREELIRATTKS